jgi:hypothetical protein
LLTSTPVTAVMGSGSDAAWLAEIGQRAHRIKAAYTSRAPWKAKYYRIRIDLDAEVDLEQAVSWYERAHPTLVSPLLQEISHALCSLRTSPSSFGLVTALPAALGVRRLALREFPYVVAYVQIQAEVRIIAVAHRRRRRTAPTGPISRNAVATIEDWLNRQGVRAPERSRLGPAG